MALKNVDGLRKLVQSKSFRDPPARIIDPDLAQVVRNRFDEAESGTRRLAVYDIMVNTHGGITVWLNSAISTREEMSTALEVAASALDILSHHGFGGRPVKDELEAAAVQARRASEEYLEQSEVMKACAQRGIPIRIVDGKPMGAEPA